MEVRQLLEQLEIDWERLRGPALDRGKVRPDRKRGQGGSPPLKALRTEHLRSVTSLCRLYRGAALRGLAPRSEGGLIAFLSTAAYCLRVGENPASLFGHLLRAGEFPATLRDEDRAISALKGLRAARREKCPWLKPRNPDGV